MVPEEAPLNIRAEEAFTVFESRTNRRPRDGKPEFWLKLQSQPFHRHEIPQTWKYRHASVSAQFWCLITGGVSFTQ
jgi:hypothetical protein